jgi:hypothetical protein
MKDDRMNDKKILMLFYCILVTGSVLLAGCSYTDDRAQGTITTILTPVTGGSSPKTPANPSFISPTMGTPDESPDFDSLFSASELLTRPTNTSVMVSLVPKVPLEIYVLYGISRGEYTCQTPSVPGNTGLAWNITLQGLLPDTEYYYRVCYREPGSNGYQSGAEHTFHTQRSPGSTFTFGIQADSHPEREKQMFNSTLYERTLDNVAQDQPDFYITLGDDFSIDPLIENDQLSQASVDAVYLNQRNYLGGVGSDSPIFLVNGNHEEGARYMLDGTPDNAAVYAGTSRMKFFPQPVPGGFYTGDSEAVEYVGLPGDYYAWTWGDALFVVIDPYWHTPGIVDHVPGEDATIKRDPWVTTLGEAQYQWFKNTLEESEAPYKFVFAHHVQGTGRGGIENAGLYEWGGNKPKGGFEFDTKRPGWELPIHQLMAENGVTAFFQGHDHLFAQQELDGVTYQEVPLPADPTYSTFNANAYRSGTTRPNSGYLRVTVSPRNATVDYVKSYLPGKMTASENNGMVGYSYSLAPR